MRLGLLASSFSPFPHCGHIRAMQDAIEAGACDAIRAALHIDPSVERHWKRSPPLTADEREILLRAIRYVHAVVRYETEQHLEEIISSWPPACLIIGEDHRGRDYTGQEFEIPVFWASRSYGWSGTAFAERIAVSITEDWP